MKVLATIFLTCVIFIQTFSTYFIKADFYLNQSFIAKTLCVNQDKPMMHCNGKCYLSKKITDQQKKDHSPISKTEKFDVQSYFLPDAFLINNTFFVVFHHNYFMKKENVVSFFSTSIFHPPTA
ncbi:MAG: hypothetical protein ABI366_00820 [Ginsengibacter sp.]